MKKLALMPLLASLAIGLVGCKKDPPETLDLSKDNSDTAQKIMEGRPIDGAEFAKKTAESMKGDK